MANILLVDDDRHHLQAMWRAFWLDGRHEAERFTDPQEALSRARDRGFDVVVCDYRMPEMDGMEFLKRFRVVQPTAFRILISGYADMTLFTAAVKDNRVQHLLEKPCEGAHLLRTVQEGLDQVLAGREIARLRQELEALQREHAALIRRVGERVPELLVE